LDLAKYLGEGTSRKEAEEKSSAFFICGGGLVGKQEMMLLPLAVANLLTQNVISDAEE
jgi:hypothetical protein